MNCDVEVSGYYPRILAPSGLRFSGKCRSHDRARRQSGIGFQLAHCFGPEDLYAFAPERRTLGVLVRVSVPPLIGPEASPSSSTSAVSVHMATTPVAKTDTETK